MEWVRKARTEKKTDKYTHDSCVMMWCSLGIDTTERLFNYWHWTCPPLIILYKFCRWISLCVRQLSFSLRIQKRSIEFGCWCARVFMWDRCLYTDIVLYVCLSVWRTDSAFFRLPSLLTPLLWFLFIHARIHIHSLFLFASRNYFSFAHSIV